MCGIAGFIDLNKRLIEPVTTLNSMNDAVAYRGPDGHGTWMDNQVSVGLAHRRLAIVDLSSEGHQPMTSRSGRYTISYNGEVYNFTSLRDELIELGYTFRGHSDTEIILHAFEAWGVANAVSRFIGMFAIALWDSAERKMYLVRDRLGIKPLYYGEINGIFAFASELKSLKEMQDFSQPVDRGSVALFLRYGYIPSPYTIYKDINKLKPGTILSLSIADNNTLEYQYKCFWSVNDIAEQGVISSFNTTDANAINQLDSLLRDSIGLRMLADVPLGAFLSGGIDSSLTTALMQAQNDKPVKTFTIGFNEESYNEAKYAKDIAHYIGTDHTELYVSSSQAMDVIPKLPFIYDEPFADPSQIPTFLLSELTRKHVTVSLSGDGGDELFFGYSRYLFAQRIWNNIHWLPSSVRKLFGIIHDNTSMSESSKFSVITDLLSQQSRDDLYNRTVSAWKHPENIVIGSKEPLVDLTGTSRNIKLADYPERMMFFDQISYLPDDILVKLDRASMGVSLEARVPLLDHRVVEFAWNLPQSLKYRDGETKWILRQVLDRYLPRNLVERPKKGFGVPIDSWLRGPLRDWAEDLLNENRLLKEGFFKPEPIREKWQQHLSGKYNWCYYLWRVLMFQSWLNNNSS